MARIARLCEVDGCGRKHLARGMCKRHYYQRPEWSERERGYSRAYRQRNPEWARRQQIDLEHRALADPSWRRAVAYASNARRRARLLGARVEARIDYRGILLEFGMVCHLCGGAISVGQLQFDHVVPLAVGGPHSRDNLRPAHALCNQRKGSKI